MPREFFEYTLGRQDWRTSACRSVSQAPARPGLTTFLRRPQAPNVQRKMWSSPALAASGAWNVQSLNRADCIRAAPPFISCYWNPVGKPLVFDRSHHRGAVCDSVQEGTLATPAKCGHSWGACSRNGAAKLRSLQKTVETGYLRCSDRLFRMRGGNKQLYRSLEETVPQDHPLWPIRKLVDQVLTGIQRNSTGCSFHASGPSR